MPHDEDRGVERLHSGSLDALPHNGAVITLLSVCGIDHRETYTGILIVAIAAPMISLMVIMLCASFFGSF